MLRVVGVLVQQLAGHFRALAAVGQALFLAAGCHRTLPVEGVAVGGNTALASAALDVFAAMALQAAAGGDFVHGMYLL